MVTAGIDPCIISTRVELGKTRNCMETRQYGKNVLFFFYNIAMSKARRIRKISVFTSGGKFPVLTLSYINTALSQSAFRIYKCYIIIFYCIKYNIIF